MREVDVQGLSCPIPVIEAKKAMDAHADAKIAVLIDEEAARENVTRMAENAGWSVERGEGLNIILIPKGA